MLVTSTDQADGTGLGKMIGLFTDDVSLTGLVKMSEKLVLVSN